MNSAYRTGSIVGSFGHLSVVILSGAVLQAERRACPELSGEGISRENAVSGRSRPETVLCSIPDLFQIPAYHAYPASEADPPVPFPNAFMLSVSVRCVMYLM